MKEKYKKYIFFLLPLSLMFIGKLSAQSQGEHKRIDRIQQVNFDRLLEAVQEVQFPVVPEVKRIAIVDFEYSRRDIADNIADMVMVTLEQALTTNGYQVVKIPELHSHPVTYIQSKDSSIRISHLKPANKIRSSGDSLFMLMRKYGIQGFIDCTLSYDLSYGYMLFVQLSEGSTRILLSSKMLMSKHERSHLAVNSFHVDAGLGSFVNSFFEPPNKKKTFAASSNTFNTNFTWRQSFNYRNTGYFGYNIGLDIIQSISSSDSLGYNFTSYVPHAGIKYYLSFLKRNNDDQDYYMEFYQGVGIYSSRSFTLFLEQGLNLNLTKNMGMAVNFKYLFGHVELPHPNTILDLGNLNFGVNTYFRF